MSVSVTVVLLLVQSVAMTTHAVVETGAHLPMAV